MKVWEKKISRKKHNYGISSVEMEGDIMKEEIPNSPSER